MNDGAQPIGSAAGGGSPSSSRDAAQPTGSAAGGGSPASPGDAAQAQGRAGTAGFRVFVDRDLCQGHGVCESEAPEVFELGKKATTITVLDDHPAADQRRAVEAAVRYCPTHALSIVDDADEPADAT